MECDTSIKLLRDFDIGNSGCTTSFSRFLLASFSFKTGSYRYDLVLLGMKKHYVENTLLVVSFRSFHGVSLELLEVIFSVSS